MMNGKMVTMQLEKRLMAVMMAMMMTRLCVRASRLEFDMVFQKKCIYQDVDFDETSIAGYYKAFHKDDPTVLVRLGFTVEGPGGEKLYNADAQEQSFYFEDTKEGEYKLCWNAKDYHIAQSTKILLEWSEGADATDWENVAKKEHLDAIHTELLRLEDSVYNIHLELQNIRRKEEIMRDLNEITNARVAWFSIGALLTCVGAALLQFLSMRKFFIRKKVL